MINNETFTRQSFIESYFPTILQQKIIVFRIGLYSIYFITFKGRWQHDLFFPPFQSYTVGPPEPRFHIGIKMCWRYPAVIPTSWRHQIPLSRPGIFTVRLIIRIIKILSSERMSHFVTMDTDPGYTMPLVSAQFGSTRITRNPNVADFQRFRKKGFMRPDRICRSAGLLSIAGKDDMDVIDISVMIRIVVGKIYLRRNKIQCFQKQLFRMSILIGSVISTIITHTPGSCVRSQNITSQI